MNRLCKPLRPILLAISMAALSLSQASWAEEPLPPVDTARWYQVNITLFQQKPDSSLDETFPFDPINMQEYADVIRLRDKSGIGISDSALNSPLALHHENVSGPAFIKQPIDEDWQEVVNRLDPIQQPILVNLQWIQPTYDKPFSLPIYLESSLTHLDVPKLQGLFRMHVSRYLHGEFNLQYLHDSSESVEQMASITQSRRMRSKEAHYLDHPLVGVIMRALPVEHPLKTDEEKDNSDNSTENPASTTNSVLNQRI